MSRRFTLSLAALLAAALSAQTTAGELILFNGDRLAGELVDIDGESLTWDSGSFGELPVDTGAVRSLSSATRIDQLSYEGSILQGCLVGIVEGAMRLDCNDQGAPVVVAGESLPTKPDSETTSEPGTTGEIKLAWSKQSGNSDESSLDSSLSVGWESRIAHHSVTAEADREENNSTTTKENYDLDYQADFPIRGNWVGIGHAAYEYDRFASETDRYELGAGVGYRPKLHPDVVLKLDLGTGYVVREFQDGSDDNGFAGRWRLDSQWNTGLRELTLFHRHIYSWPFNDPQSYLLETSTGLKIPLMASLFAELRYDYDRLGEEQPGTVAADREWVFSLGYGW